MRIALIDDSTFHDWTDGAHLFHSLVEPLQAQGHEVLTIDAASLGPHNILTGLSRERNAYPLMASVRVAAALIQASADVCLFPERRGLAHCSLMARACDEIPPTTRIALWRGPEPPSEFIDSGWERDGLREIVCAAMRRFSATSADAILSSDDAPDLTATFALFPASNPISEYVFVGPLARRSGFVAFVETMEILGRRGDLDGKHVTLIGAFDDGDQGVDREWLGRRAAGWRFRFAVKETRSLSKAVSHLRGRGQVALMAGVGPDVLRRLEASTSKARPVPVELHFQPSKLAAFLVDGAGIHDAGATGEARAAHKLIDIGSEDVRPFARENVALSFCILHHDRPALLQQALDSILSQIDRTVPTEIIIVDNASKLDASKTVLQAAARHACVDVIALEEPLPYSSALNVAAGHAHHPFLVFLDDDNLLVDGALARLATACGQGCFDVVTSNLVLFDEDPSKPVGLMSFIGPAHTAGLFFNGLGDNCMAFRRENFLRIGGYLQRDGAYPSADWILLCRAQAAGLRIGVLQQPAFLYRRSLSKSAMHWQPWDQQAVRALVLTHYGSCFDAGELARVVQAMALELGV